MVAFGAIGTLLHIYLHFAHHRSRRIRANQTNTALAPYSIFRFDVELSGYTHEISIGDEYQGGALPLTHGGVVVVVVHWWWW